MKQLYRSNRGNLVRQGLGALLALLLTFALVSCVPGAENPFEGLFEPAPVEEEAGTTTDLAPESTAQPLVVEVAETPIDELEQTLIADQAAGEETILRVVTLEETTEDSAESTTDSASTTNGTTGETETTATSENTSATTSEASTETSSESTTETSATSEFTTSPLDANVSAVARAEDPEIIIIEYTNVDSIQEDASLSNFFSAGPHTLLAMRDEDEMIGIATLASDGTLSLRTTDVLNNSRPADETFIGCMDVMREFQAGSEVFGGIAFFESITVPGLILTPVLDINGDGTYIPPVNYVRLTDPLLVSGTCFELESAVESVQASFLGGWNRLLREIDWRDIARGNTEAQDSSIQKTLWSVNNNAETVVKWLYSRP